MFGCPESDSCQERGRAGPVDITVAATEPGFRPSAQAATQRSAASRREPCLPVAGNRRTLFLDQVPVFDSFSGESGSGDLFIDPCESEVDEPDPTVCRTPLCEQETLDELACDDPRCIALIPLTAQEEALVESGVIIPRLCDAPALPSFPVIAAPEPGLLGLLAGVLALSGLEARRRSRPVRNRR